MTSPPRPRIMVLGTGGTIAATAQHATMLADYAVTENINSVLTAVPELHKLADIQCQQVCNVDSRDMSNTLLLLIAGHALDALRRPDVDGIVITHGTDTLEETAYFLDLVLPLGKPVVLTGAMRPATALSPDGPLNLYNAVLLATSPLAHQRGVMVLMNDQVHAARFVTKTHTTQPDAFRSADHGCLGLIANGQLHMAQSPVPRSGAAGHFDASALHSLPLVDIIYDHQNAGQHLYTASVAAGARGIVFAGTGNGSLSASAVAGAAYAVQHGVMCVRASRVGAGLVSASNQDAEQGLICAGALNPQKARILLMLSLALDRDIQQIQGYFLA
ncbi:MAG: asparaginase [Burkholderiaceae bacterium]|nr:asparaginase [Burkholderiaceae bacterium]